MNLQLTAVLVSCRKLDSLLKAQARELSLLRQRLREGQAACGVLRRHLADATRAFEELLRANDVDYYTGQSFREQLAQSAALAQRVGARIAGREWPRVPEELRTKRTLADSCCRFPTGDPSEDPEETTELLAVRSELSASCLGFCRESMLFSGNYRRTFPPEGRTDPGRLVKNRPDGFTR